MSESAQPVAVDGPASFATSFPPSVSLVGAVRRFVFTFYTRIIGDRDHSSLLALATHELVENAVAYCAGGEVTVRVTVAPAGSGHLVRVRTRNAASPEDIAKLERIIEQLRATEDPVGFFRERMRQTIREATGSGLGLPRIRAEAGLELECFVIGGDVELIAQTVLTTKADS